ncbi:hypothetical protein CAPTEDRAFT_157309 [Capitella teleta]|uniref:Ubiquitin-like domain-containing protein n=1 Tax=Capitella teleta TaxID=283909 RepID=R7V618_CAPTE|nr:hypothetical protein CAPTEDRAFT_157309 [Capitella teleta]|eukprot:ELU11180.1 hypothetical protein CAPTEDRAFT_157309 [Capitella teleta]
MESVVEEKMESMEDKEREHEESNPQVYDQQDQQHAPLNHKEFVEQFQDFLSELIVGDPLLQDLPSQVTVEEIRSQIALEHGQAMTVNVRRGDDKVLPIVVLQNATVADLKKAIRHYFHLNLNRDGDGDRHISWRYVWKRNWLYFNGQKLTEDKTLLKDYGIFNSSEVTFIKRLR